MRKMKNGKRILSVFLTLSMVFSMSGAPSFAWEDAQLSKDQGLSAEFAGRKATDSNAATPSAASKRQAEIPLDDTVTELEAGKTYTISSLEELERLTELVNDPDTNQASRETKYELLEDIDNAGNIMIGTGAENPSESVKSYFKGSFNGNGHVIRGLAITADPDSMKGQDAVGLFRHVAGGSTIQQLGVEGTVTVTAAYSRSYRDAGCNVGSLVGVLEGSSYVKQCYSACEITVDQDLDDGAVNVSAGGLVGTAKDNGWIMDCYTTGDVSIWPSESAMAIGHAGGVVGQMQEGAVQRCYATGTVTGPANSGFGYQNPGVGGIAGYVASYRAYIEKCCALNVKITALGENAQSFGRLAGYVGSSGMITDCSARQDMVLGKEGEEAMLKEEGWSDLQKAANGQTLSAASGNDSLMTFFRLLAASKNVWNQPGETELAAGAELPSLIAFDGTGTDTPLLPEGEGGTIDPLWDAEAPVIIKNLEKKSVVRYELNQTAEPLTIEVAEPTDGGTINYRWRRTICDENGDRGNNSVEFIPDSNKPSCTPSSSEIGIHLYDCEVTNENLQATGKKTASKATYGVIVIIEEPKAPVENAEEPKITLDTTGKSDYWVGDEAEELRIKAESQDGGTLSYQWYSNINANYDTGTAIEGATEPAYTPSTEKAGQIFHWCVITNTNEKATVNKTAQAVSTMVNVHTMAVDKPYFIVDLDEKPRECIQLDSLSLRVDAMSENFSTLTCQWYQSTDKENWELLSGKTQNILPVPTNEVGTVYYRCQVTSQKSFSGVMKEVKINSKTATIVVNPPPEKADKPVITLDLEAKTVTYQQNQKADELYIGVMNPKDGGEISYQWYRSLKADQSGAEAIDGAKSSNYLPSSEELGTTYYWCVVTNTNEKATQEKEVSVSTQAVTIVVEEAKAQRPSLGSNANEVKYTKGEEPKAMIVDAWVTDGGTLSYQWYEMADGQWKLIEGAVEKSYKPSTKDSGLFRYKCAVTNTILSGDHSTIDATWFIEVSGPVTDAKPPILLKDLDEEMQTCEMGSGNFITLTVDAKSEDGGKVEYQWFKNDVKSMTGAAWLPMYNNEKTIIPHMDKPGITYYFCKIINFKPEATGNQTAEVMSKIACVQVLGREEGGAQYPTVSSDAGKREYAKGEKAAKMGVTAWVTDGGTLSYQWYVKNGDGQWNAIEGAAGSSYLPSTEIPGTYEYQCRVTNTIESGNQRTTTVGWTVKVLDKEPDQPAEPEKPENNGGSSGSSGTGESKSSLPVNYRGATKLIEGIRVPEYVTEGTWQKEAGGWNFYGANGSYANVWAAAFNPYANILAGQSAFDWFRFDENGYMMTGWYTDENGDTYYLNPVSDNTLGRMVTGWYLIDGVYYYFNEEPDGTRGKMYRNTRTPDGYLVDENGKLVE